MDSLPNTAFAHVVQSRYWEAKEIVSFVLRQVGRAAHLFPIPPSLLPSIYQPLIFLQASLITHLIRSLRSPPFPSSSPFPPTPHPLSSLPPPFHLSAPYPPISLINYIINESDKISPVAKHLLSSGPTNCNGILMMGMFPTTLGTLRKYIHIHRLPECHMVLSCVWGGLCRLV